MPQVESAFFSSVFQAPSTPRTAYKCLLKQLKVIILLPICIECSSFYHFYQLSKADKAAIFVPTLEMRQFGNKGGQDLVPFALLIGDEQVRSLPAFPLATFPLHQYHLCLRTSAGAILYSGPAQLSAGLPFHQVSSAWTHSYTLLSESLQRYLLSSSSIPSNQLPKFWIHSSLHHLTSPSDTINTTL